MPIVTKPNTFTANQIIDANQMNQNFDSIYGLVNGSLDAANLAVSAINDSTKLAGEVVIPSKSKGLIYGTDLYGQNWVVSGGLASFSGSPVNQIQVSTVIANILQVDGTYRHVSVTATSYTTSALSSTYFLDLQPDGTISWATTHSIQAGYMPLATVTTNGSGNVNVLTDVRVLSAAIAWLNISKSGSSLADLATRNAADLTGTLAAAQLPAHTGEATSSAGSANLTLTNSAVIAKLLTGYVSGAGIVASTDSILAAIQKLDGNDALKVNITNTLTAMNALANGAVGDIFTATMAVTCNVFDVLYLSSSGYNKAKADADATLPSVAMCLATGTGSQNVLKKGYVKNSGWTWTAGQLLYISTATAGAITSTLPSTSGNRVQIIGYAESATVIYFNPDYTFVQV